jgi:hypothetical protein
VNVQWGNAQPFTYIDIDTLHSLGFKTVRLGIYWNEFMPTNSTTINQNVFTSHAHGDAYQNILPLDTIVSYCNQLGMKVILNLLMTAWMMPPAWAQLPTVFSEAMWDAFIGGGPTSVAWQGFLNGTRALAQRYAGQPNVIFEVTNEPFVSVVGNYTVLWKQLVEAYVDAVRAVETVQHLILTPFLVPASTWEEALDEQPDIERTNVGWVQHVYTPYGVDYYPNDPSHREWGYDYDTGTTGWISYDKYVYWRIRRVADWCNAHGKPLYYTEFGREKSRLNWDYYLNYVLTTGLGLGLDGWIFHPLEVINNGDWGSVLYGSGATRTVDADIVKVLNPFISETGHTLSVTSNPSGFPFSLRKTA